MATTKLAGLLWWVTLALPLHQQASMHAGCWVGTTASESLSFGSHAFLISMLIAEFLAAPPPQIFRKRRDKLAPHEHEPYLRYMMFVLETAVREHEARAGAVDLDLGSCR